MLKLSVPQVIMLNHAAWVNRENSDRKYEANKSTDNKRTTDPLEAAEERKMNSMSPAELSAYMASNWE